jgi:hypothetical protein
MLVCCQGSFTYLFSLARFHIIEQGATLVLTPAGER